MIMSQNKKTLWVHHGRTINEFLFCMSVLKNFCHNWTQPLENKITSAVNKVKPIFCSSFYFERTKKTHCKERNKDAGSFNRKLGVQKKDATLAWLS